MRRELALDVVPGLDAPGGLGGRCCRRSRRGGTGGREDWGARDMGEGGRSTCNVTLQLRESSGNLSLHTYSSIPKKTIPITSKLISLSKYSSIQAYSTG